MSTVKSLVMKNSFVLLQEEHEPDMTPSGIFIPQPKWKRRCKVVSACLTSGLSVGETVLRNVGKGTDIELDDVEYEILHSDWIIAVLHE